MSWNDFEGSILHRIGLITIALGLAVSPLAGTVLAQENDSEAWEQSAKLTEPGTSFLGHAVAIDGDRAVLGAPGEGAGSAYVYENDGAGWERTAELTASDGEPNDFFGEDVALDGDRILVGAQFHDGTGEASAGAAYVFVLEEDGWTQTSKLTAQDADARDKFGSSVALNGSTALVGAPQDDAEGEDAGGAYVFELDETGWFQESKLSVEDSQEGQLLGADVALDGDRAILGAPFDDAPDASNAGAVYAFERAGTGTFEQAAKLLAPTPVANAQLGSDVALEGTVALAGAIGHPGPDGVLPDGAAFVFEDEGSDWGHAATLTDDNDRPSSSTGTSVALDGDRALVSGEEGLVFTHEDGWTLTSSFEPLDEKPGDGFGWASALDGDQTFVTARNADTQDGRDTGAAYVFQACTEDGPASKPVHESVEPAVGDTLGSEAEEQVHAENCLTVDQLEDPSR